jgi:hypothetical protein
VWWDFSYVSDVVYDGFQDIFPNLHCASDFEPFTDDDITAMEPVRKKDRKRRPRATHVLVEVDVPSQNFKQARLRHLLHQHGEHQYTKECELDNKLRLKIGDVVKLRTEGGVKDTWIAQITGFHVKSTNTREAYFSCHWYYTAQQTFIGRHGMDGDNREAGLICVANLCSCFSRTMLKWINP